MLIKMLKFVIELDNKIESIKCRIISANEKSVFVKYLKSDLSIPYDQIEHAKVLLSFK